MTITVLPRRFTEQQVAAELTVSIDTVRRERHRGKLGYLRLGRRIFITEDQLRAYLNRQSKEPCPIESDPAKSPAIGLAGETTHPTGAAPGSIQPLDRHAAARLAQLTFGKPN